MRPLSLFLLATSLTAAPDPYAGLKFRSIGPAMISGRIVDIAVDPANAAHYFIAAASGGVWKTANNGTSWTPIFDNEGSYSIGALALDPKNPAVLWVGTGEANSQRSVSYGDGIYRSEDAGRTWRNLGLKSSEHIARIAIDPRDSRTVYVAAQGPLWAPGGDRGLYKTTDSGRTWTKVLAVSENTGVTDVALDPRNPDTLIAATYQRRRHTWTLIDGGPESAIYRSTDAGATWGKITAGIPSEDLGRITFAPSPKDPALVYASIEAANKKSGVFRSTDFGSSWELRSPIEFAGMYFGRIYADPHAADRVYFMNVRMTVSDDGGKTFHPLGEKYKHSDNHVIWIDPRDPAHYLVGCDGGLYESYDRAANWAFKSNLPLGQFYDITTDSQAPFYNVFGGTQDNSSVGGPARTRNQSGITNADWFVTQGGDGFHSRVDPEDPNTVYAELQYGVLVRFDRRTGERLGIQPQPGPDEEPYRWNWDAPLLISPHNHNRIYFAAQKLFRSDDRGSSWRAVSPDLSQQIDRNKLQVMGRIWGPDAVAKNTSTAFYSNISSLAESPKKEGLLYAGTDDGWLQVSEDGGGHWRKSNDFPGVPARSYVSRVLASQHDVNTVYTSLENHQSGDFNPYLLRSTNAGKSWTSIRGDLPANGAVYAIAEDHKNPNLLFAGTEYGLYFTVDGGTKWNRLKSGLPTIAVRDLSIQKQQDDLVAGTFGRGIYILDDYSLLRNLNLTADAILYGVRDVLEYVQAAPYGQSAKASQGEAFFSAENPPYGATLTYYLKSGLKTRADKRREAEKKGGILTYPDAEAFRAEATEEPPAVILTISDAEGHPVRRLTGPATAGFHRITWDLREPAPVLGRPQRAEPDEDENSGPRPAGPAVLPGKYRVSLAQRVDGIITPVTGTVAFTVKGPAGETTTLTSFQQKIAKLQRSVVATLESANTLKTNLGTMKRALYETPGASTTLINTATSLDKRTDEILLALRGDLILRAHDENTPPSISERVQSIQMGQRMSTAPPTATQQKDYEVATAELTVQQSRLKTLIGIDAKKLEQQLETLGAPYTPRL
ncbi:MAG: glycosyl hydrolase [Acidobacteriota bacterium]|nr:glycosyl hydrolase [Acidobacteriota bacterium]